MSERTVKAVNDSKIIALFFERSQQGISELSEKYGKLCMKVAVNILKNEEDSKECVNDAYLALWNTIPPERPDRLSSYLLKIVRNTAIKKYHSNTAVKRNSFYDTALQELEEVLRAAETPEGELDMKELTEAVNTFLGTISKENRIFFIRRYFFGDAVKSIAELTGNSPHFVTVRLSRTREDLRKYLKERELI